MLQAKLPYVPIPIRIDVNLQPFRPAAALPVPGDARAWGIDETLPPYKSPDITMGYRLKDNFLWNLFEAINTPDQFARGLVEDLDLPVDRRVALITEITTQIRQQLEEYAGVALHPLFETERSTKPGTVPDEDLPSPSDDFRCIINLNITLRNQSLTDRFEWNLLHPPGVLETFAQNLSADMGLTGEWTAAITHGLYEAVLRMKKEAIEKGGLRAAGIGNVESNETEPGKAIGWRYDPETLCALWGPHIETLTKEDMEKREYDRERQIRRARRETARFSSTANVAPPTDYFAMPDADTPMGRGERNKRKRRFRSISPNGRGTPDGAAGAGYGGQGGGLQEWERQNWRCFHCGVWGHAVWGVRDGPKGHRTLCHNCGYLYEKLKKLPAWAKDIHAFVPPLNNR
jgi:chromatin structure-remodeling complex subunit SFH1